MQDDLRRAIEVIMGLAAQRPDELVVPIDEGPGFTRGGLLDEATARLSTIGYHLVKVRSDGATWVATYLLGARRNWTR